MPFTVQLATHVKYFWISKTDYADLKSDQQLAGQLYGATFVVQLRRFAKTHRQQNHDIEPRLESQSSASPKYRLLSQNNCIFLDNLRGVARTNPSRRQRCPESNSPGLRCVPGGSRNPPGTQRPPRAGLKLSGHPKPLRAPANCRDVTDSPGRSRRSVRLQVLAFS